MRPAGRPAGATDGLDGSCGIKRPGPARRLDGRPPAELRDDLMAGPRERGFKSVYAVR